MSLIDDVLAGQPRAVARAISLIEDDSAAGRALISGLFTHTGHAYVIGVTGPPGVGKSTLVDRLVAAFRGAGQRVGVLAVDPSSPFSGGAILGDRVRMQAHAQDPGVFIRSMATRGQLGGLARATADAALVLDAAGQDVVLIETVGVGQDEVDIVRTADVSIVMVAPGAGDDVQALKAGVMEIADLFVVNKIDQEGADRTVAAIAGALELRSAGPDDWRPPICRTDALTGRGIDELLEALERFRRERPAAAIETRRRERDSFRVRELLGREFVAFAERRLGAGVIDQAAAEVAERRIDPYGAAERLLTSVLEAAGARGPRR